MRRWSAGTPAQVAAMAGPRATDVFMGVDVFGRGTYGGGQVGCAPHRGLCDVHTSMMGMCALGGVGGGGGGSA